MQEFQHEDIEILISHLETSFGANTDKTIELSMELLAIAENLRHPRGHATALRYLGNAKRAQGKYEEAEKYLQEGLSIAQSVNLLKETAGILLYLGNLYIDLDRLDEALIWLQQAADLYESLGTPEGHAKALLTIGNLHIEQERPEPALINAKEALLLYTQVQNEHGTTLALAVIGLCYGIQQDYHRAIEITMRALPYFIESNLTYNIAAIKLNLGEYYCAIHDPAKALYYLHDALNIAIDGKLFQLEGFIRCQLGVAAAQQRLPALAREELRIARSIAHRIHSKPVLRRVNECDIAIEE